MLKMTKNKLFFEVQKFYKGVLTEEKAIKLYEFEYGETPELETNRDLFGQRDFSEYPWFVNAKSLTFMKDLQESGAVNMFSSTAIISSSLHLDKNDSKELLMVYIKDYTKIYYPEQLI